MEDSSGSTDPDGTTEESGCPVSGPVCVLLVLAGLVIVSALLVLLAVVCAPKDDDGASATSKTAVVRSVSFEKEGAVYAVSWSKDTQSGSLQQHFILAGTRRWFGRVFLGGKRWEGGTSGGQSPGTGWSDCLHKVLLHLRILMSGTLRNNVEATVPNYWCR